MKKTGLKVKSKLRCGGISAQHNRRVLVVKTLLAASLAAFLGMFAGNDPAPQGFCPPFVHCVK